MKTTDKPSRIDYGRLAAVAVFSFLMILNFLGVGKETRTLSPMDATKALAFAHHLLVAGFYVLIIFLYFLRSSASATARSFSVKFIAVFTSFVPFLLPLFPGPKQTGPVMLAISNLVMLAAMVFTLAALSTLGKSFSIIPQARKLVTRGPYRIIRHPLYLGEITGTLGLFLAGASIARVLTFLLLVACQVYRALEEEKLLTSIFPEYAGYASKTARFVPGLF